MTDISKSSQQLVKETNMRLVFNLIHRNEVISRADIKKITKLSATTVSSLVEELICEGLVEECGIKDTTTSGRKAVNLKISPHGGYFVGLDIQKKSIIADLYTLDFSVENHIEVAVKKGDSIAMEVMHALSSVSRGRKVFGITIGLPGVIDTKTNTLISSTVLDTEDAKDIYEILRKAMPRVNIFLKNNSGLIALAEKEWGGYGETDNLISIDIDDGVGAGILIDGSIYDGSGMAGEFGHISVDYNGNRCKCGSYGCLEMYASIPSILERTECESLKELRFKLDNGSEALNKIIKEVANALAFGINTIVNLLDPELVVMGGPIKILGNYLLEPLRERFSEIVLVKDKTIEFSHIEGNAVTLGGATYAFNMMFGI